MPLLVEKYKRWRLGWLLEGSTREFKQIATAGAATAIAVEEVWREYVAVAAKIQL